MDFLDAFTFLFHACQVFGLAPYKIRKLRYKNLLVVCPEALIYTKIITGICFLSAVTFFATAPEFAPPFSTPLKIVRVFFSFVFTTNALSIYFGTLKKAKIICRCYNIINEPLSEVTVKKLSSFNRTLIIWYTFLHLVSNSLSLPLALQNQASFAENYETFFLLIWSFPEDFFICSILSLINLINFKIEKINGCLRSEINILDNPKEYLREIQRLKIQDTAVRNFLDTYLEMFQYNYLHFICQLFMSAITLTIPIIQSKNPKFHVLGFLGYIICRLTPIFMILDIIKNKAEKTAHYVHDLFLDNNDPEIKEEVEIFSLQLQHRKVEFNACGFFKLDFTLLYSMIGAVTTYIIILMQFQKDDPTSAEWQMKKNINCSVLLSHYSASDLHRCLNHSVVKSLSRQ